MLPVKIKKGGTLVQNRKKEEVDISSKLLFHFHDACEFEDGLTLKDIFILVRPFVKTISSIFTHSPDWMSEIIEEGLQPTQDKSNLSCLELGWMASLSSYAKQDVPYLQVDTNFIGLGPIPDDDKLYENWPDKNINYAIDMTPVNQLINLPIKMNEYFDLRDEREGYNPTAIIAKVKKEFTLFDVLFGIFWELSFFGSPTNRDKERKEIERRFEEIKSGKAELIPWEDIKKRLEDKIKK